MGRCFEEKYGAPAAGLGAHVCTEDALARKLQLRPGTPEVSMALWPFWLPPFPRLSLGNILHFCLLWFSVV